MSAATARTLGGNGHDPVADVLRDELREVQDLPPEKPHAGRGLAMVKKEEARTITVSANFTAVILFLIVQAIGAIWWARGIDSEKTQLRNEMNQLRDDLKFAEAVIVNVKTEYARLQGANDFAKYLESQHKEEDRRYLEERKQQLGGGQK